MSTPVLRGSTNHKAFCVNGNYGNNDGIGGGNRPHPNSATLIKDFMRRKLAIFVDEISLVSVVSAHMFGIMHQQMLHASTNSTIAPFGGRAVIL